MIQLTQKEQQYLQDAKKHEELCVAKYSNYAQDTSDQNLKQLFQWAGQIEQNHLDSVNQMLQGEIPANLTQSQGQGQPQQGQQQNSLAAIQSQLGLGQANSSQMATQGATNNNQTGMLDNQTVCNDMLTVEKQIASFYENALLESSNQQLRQAISHIQKEEEDHAFAIQQYMQQQGWY